MSIPSPYFLAPINTGFASDGVPDQRLMAFHQVRSGHGIGISYVGNVAIGEHCRVSTATPQIDRAPKVWRDLAATITDNGSVAGIQLACQLDNEPASRKWRNPDQRSYIARQRRFLSSLPAERLSRIVSGFVSAAQHAVDAGFKVVQIHSAHGYLLSRLLNPTLNVRTDAFGEDRTLMLSQIVRRIREANARVIVDVRISIESGLEASETDRGITRRVVASIIESGADIVSLSSGMYEVNRFQIYPTLDMGHACYGESAKTIADEWPSTVVNVAGNISNLGDLEGACSNLTFSIGRALIADPEFVSKSVLGRMDEIRECRRTGHCHYFSRGKAHIECGVNDEL